MKLWKRWKARQSRIDRLEERVKELSHQLSQVRGMATFEEGWVKTFWGAVEEPISTATALRALYRHLQIDIKPTAPKPRDYEVVPWPLPKINIVEEENGTVKPKIDPA